MVDTPEAGDAKSETLPPEDAFRLIGNETRARILQILGDANRGEGPPTPLTFSELRERAAPESDSGQFNYHLDQLVGHFVKRGDDGYWLLPAGLQVYRTILAGAFTRTVTIEPFEVGQVCYRCDGAIVASYDDGLLYVACDTCETLYQAVEVPPSAVENVDQEALLTQLERYNRHLVMAYAYSVCPYCSNRLTTDFYEGDEVSHEALAHREVLVHQWCSHCTAEMYLPIGELLLFQAELIAFYHDHGIDVFQTPLWELPFAATDDGVSILSREPWEIELTVTADDAHLRLVIDDELTIQRTTTREPTE